MKYILFLFIYCFSSLSSSLANSVVTAKSTHNKIIFLKGTPYVLKGKKLSVITKKTILKDKDIIKTGARDLLIIKSKASTYKISPNSFIKLDLREPAVINSQLAWGTVVVHFARKKVEKNKVLALRIKTKTASMAVRGTTLFTNVEKNGDTTTSVEHGHVDARPLNSTKETQVRDGKSVMISNETKLAHAKPQGFEHYINWSLDPSAKNLNHPDALFSSIRKQWEDYKKENQKTWDDYTNSMKHRWQ